MEIGQYKIWMMQLPALHRTNFYLGGDCNQGLHQQIRHGWTLIQRENYVRVHRVLPKDRTP